MVDRTTGQTSFNLDLNNLVEDAFERCGQELRTGYDLRTARRSLKAWGEQKWRTKSGKKSSETGERYLPENAIKALSSQEYAATTKAKRAGKAKGKQFVAQPKSIKQKVKPFRKI